MTLKGKDKRDKKRITYVVSELSVGGVSQVVLNLCQQLNRNVFEVSLICLSDNILMLEHYPLPEDVALHLVSYEFGSKYSSLAYLANSFLLANSRRKAEPVLAKIRKLKPDILHFHTLPRELIIGLFAVRDIGCKLVFTDHLVRITPNDYKPHSRWMLAVAYRKLYRNYNLIACSKAVADADEMYGFINPKKKYLVLENQIDLREWSYIDRSIVEKRQLTVIYVARISAVKGHLDLLKAWKKVISFGIDARLLIVGPDDMNGIVHCFAKENFQEKSVVFTGTRSDIQVLLKEADVGVFPSYKEGLPISLLEKMATGLPVVVSDIGELSNIISHGKNGLAFGCGNTNELANQLIRLLKEPKLRHQLGISARKTVEKKYGKNNENVKANEEFYLSLDC